MPSQDYAWRDPRDLPDSQRQSLAHRHAEWRKVRPHDGFSAAHRRAGAAVVVVVVHVALLNSVSQLAVWRDRQPAAEEPQPIWVRLLLRPMPSPEGVVRSPAPAAGRHLSAVDRGSRDINLKVSDAAAAPPASILVALPDTAPDAPSGAASAASAGIAATGPLPLDLRLPRGSARQARNVVLDDPRVNQGRATLEDMINAAMGDGRWVMERLDGNRLRARNGPKCMELHRSRADQIDPIGASYSPKPWVAKPC